MLLFTLTSGLKQATDGEELDRLLRGISRGERECLERLSDQERQIVALHAVAGFKHREIAALLELPLSTVLAKYARAIRKLKQYLQ